MSIDDVKVFTNDAFRDERGELWTVWNEKEFEPKLKFNHDKIDV